MHGKRLVAQAALVIAATTALCVTPCASLAGPPAVVDDKAHALVAEGRRLMGEASELDKQADAKRVDAERLLEQARGLERQAHDKRVEARRKLQEAGRGARRELVADALRAGARQLLARAGDLDGLSRRHEHHALIAADRAKAEREAAAVLLKGAPDAELTKDADALVDQAKRDERFARESRESAERARAEALTLKAEAQRKLAQANVLDSDGK